MYVMADIEWVKTGYNSHYPTQIGLIRVDEKWDAVSSFYARIRPIGWIKNWKHVSFAGGTPEEFLGTDSLATVSAKLRAWLEKDDVLCWWFDESELQFRKYFPLIERTSLVLNAYMPEHFQDDLKYFQNPYVLLDELIAAYPTGKYYGDQEEWGEVPGPQHYSLSDVEGMRLALSGSQFPQDRLQLPPPPAPKKTSRKKAIGAPARAQDTAMYRYDPATNLVHTRDCSDIAGKTGLLAIETPEKAIRKDARPCPSCCKEQFRRVVFNRNADIVRRTQYTYVYAEGSKGFHKYTCKSILPAKLILGIRTYSKCIDMGLQPCKLCNPTPNDEPKPIPEQTQPRPTILQTPILPQKKKPAEKPKPQISKEKQRAFDRFHPARKERDERKDLNTMGSVDRNDFLTLTHPGYAFWVGRGYQNFHQRNCPRLKGLTHLTGFARFQNAVHAGYTPCKHCKPTKSQDVVFSIPIHSKQRDGESIDILKDLCQRQSYLWSAGEGNLFTIETPAGKWKINYSATPITLQHINLAFPRGSTTEYHQQPRLFLSLTDVFEYIDRHGNVHEKGNCQNAGDIHQHPGQMAERRENRVLSAPSWMQGDV